MVAPRVEIEFVGDRLASSRLAQAYGFVVPERRRVTGNERRDDDQRHELAGGGAHGPGGGDLRGSAPSASARTRRSRPRPSGCVSSPPAGGCSSSRLSSSRTKGFSGATLQRPALERLRDRAAEGAFEVLLCHAPDRLARRYAYPVLLLEELARSGVEVCFAKEPERGGTPEDELLRQFQPMIAEYERAQIAERTRRGKLHRARGGSQAVMSGAPYGYRYIRKSEHMEGFWEIDEAQAQVVRDVFARYVTDGVSIGELARWLTERGVPTKTGKARWDRSTVWAMLRNPAYRGQAAFGKTKTAEPPGGPTRTTRQRGERHGRRLTRTDQPAEQWTLIPVSPLVTEETFALAQARLVANAHFSTRNTKQLTLLQGVLVCRECLLLLPHLDAYQQPADQLLPLHRPGRLAPPRRQAMHQPPGPRRRA